MSDVFQFLKRKWDENPQYTIGVLLYVLGNIGVYLYGGMLLELLFSILAMFAFFSFVVFVEYQQISKNLRLQKMLSENIKSSMLIKINWIDVRTSPQQASIANLISKDKRELASYKSLLRMSSCKILKTKSSIFILPKYKSLEFISFFEYGYSMPIRIILDRNEKLNFATEVDSCKYFSRIHIEKTSVNSHTKITFTRGNKKIIDKVELVIFEDLDLPEVCVRNF